MIEPYEKVPANEAAGLSNTNVATKKQIAERTVQWREFWGKSAEIH
jgi:hypothetical protein